MHAPGRILHCPSKCLGQAKRLFPFVTSTIFSILPPYTCVIDGTSEAVDKRIDAHLYTLASANAVGEEKKLCVRRNALGRESLYWWWWLRRQVIPSPSGGRHEDHLKHTTAHIVPPALPACQVVFGSEGGATAAAVSLVDTPRELGCRSRGVARSGTVHMQHRCRSCVPQEPKMI